MYLQISSKYRTSQLDPPGNCRIQMDQMVRAGTYRLAYALIPNTFYTVSDSNNQMILDDNGVEVNITLPNGFYTSNTFPAMIKTAIDGAGTQLYTCLFSTVTNKLSISAVDEFTLIFPEEYSARDLLGFNDNNNYSILGGLTAPKILNLSPIHTINISIDDITSISQKNLQGTTFMIPIPASSLSYINYISGDSFKQTVTFHSDKRVLSIVLRDELNRVVDLNGIDYLLVLENMTQNSDNDVGYLK